MKNKLWEKELNKARYDLTTENVNRIIRLIRLEKKKSVRETIMRVKENINKRMWNYANRQLNRRKNAFDELADLETSLNPEGEVKTK